MLFYTAINIRGSGPGLQIGKGCPSVAQKTCHLFLISVLI
jgi:hypothetical protein